MSDAEERLRVETVADLGERALIERIRARVPPPPDWVHVGIGDDAAVVTPDRNAFDVLTTDALVEGVHFDRAFVPARSIGHRALAASLSDLAAMGARPRVALLSLALPDRLPVEDFDAMLDGLLALAAHEPVALVGGNIARSPGPLVVDVTAVGSAQPRRLLRRAGAKPGDVLCVSGEVGGAAAGLEWCRANGLQAAAGIPPPSSCVAAPSSPADPASPADAMRGAASRFLYPEARTRLGWVLARNRAASACVDLSDGLADAVHQMATASGVGAIVDGDAVPVAAGSRRWFADEGRDPLVAAITGGEDYELLFTLPARHQRLLQAITRQASGGRGGRNAGLTPARVGIITRDPRVILRRDGREEPLPEGFAHFR